MSAAGYPKRPPFFAYRFCRLMAKACLANEIGPEGCWLLAVIANTEDAKGYRDAVTFFNEQLYPLVGLGSVDALSRVRSKAVRAGWLHYVPGGKGRAGRYWVTVPETYLGTDDAPSDERAGKYVAANVRDSAERSPREARDNREESAETTARKVRRQPRGKCGDNREESAEHSSLTLTLSQDKPPPQTPPPGAGLPADAGRGGEGSVPVVETKRERPRDELFDAVAEVTGSDPAVTGSHVGKVKALLLKAGPPYTPAEVREFGRRFHELCPWAGKDARTRPTLGEVEKFIGRLRAPAGPAPPPPRAGPVTRGEFIFGQIAEALEGGDG